MSEVQKCQWRDRDGNLKNCQLDNRVWQAVHVFHHNGNTVRACIFHCGTRNSGEFRQQLKELVDSRHNADGKPNTADAYDFRGFIFPEAIDIGCLTRSIVNRDQAEFSRFIESAGRVDVIEATFEDAIFKDAVVLHRGIFECDASFGAAQFQGPVWFTADFSGIANFEDAEFQRNADFVGTKFKGDTRFTLCSFLLNSCFKKTEFGSIHKETFVDFTKCFFQECGEFSDCKIQGHVKWTWPGEGLLYDKESKQYARGKLKFKNLLFPEMNAILDFTDNANWDDAKTTFDECHMDKVLLRKNDCTKFELSDCTWPGSNRKVVYDELQARNNKVADVKTYRQIGITYQQLAKYYRERLNHQYAHDFDRGVFEMRLKSAQGSEKWLLCAYKTLSNFGGSIFRPLLWIFCTIVLSSFVYNVVVFDGGISISSSNWYSKPLVVAIQTSLLDWKGFRESIGSTNLSTAYAIALFQVAITSLAFTLLLFAVRRRFKH